MRNSSSPLLSEANGIMGVPTVLGQDLPCHGLIQPLGSIIAVDEYRASIKLQ
jgi:hypothetical protein